MHGGTRLFLTLNALPVNPLSFRVRVLQSYGTAKHSGGYSHSTSSNVIVPAQKPIPGIVSTGICLGTALF